MHVQTNYGKLRIPFIVAIMEKAAVVAQSVRAFASHAAGWVFESQLRQTLNIQTFRHQR